MIRLGIVSLLLVSHAAIGHVLAPALLEIQELPNPSRLEASFKRSLLTTRAVPTPLFPAGCRWQSGPPTVAAASIRQSGALDCGVPTLAGQIVAVDGLQNNPALLRWTRADGRQFEFLLSAEKSSIRLPTTATQNRLLPESIRQGAVHILRGADHLLFVLGLLLLLTGWRALLATITAFTLGHSLTLALAHFSVLRLPAQLAELAIGLSLLLIATELARNRPHSWMRRAPLLMALAFGLLHGLGFASALSELDFASAGLLWPLLGFNLGIELGQIAFLAAAMLLLAALRRQAAVERAARTLMIYGIGGLGAFFSLQRGGQWLLTSV